MRMRWNYVSRATKHSTQLNKKEFLLVRETDAISLPVIVAFDKNSKISNLSLFLFDKATEEEQKKNMKREKKQQKQNISVIIQLKLHDSHDYFLAIRILSFDLFRSRTHYYEIAIEN